MASWFSLQVFFCLTLVCDTVFGMTREQIINSGKVLKKSCMAKNSVTEEQVKLINEGTFPEEREVMCFIACLFNLAQAVKNNKLNPDGMIKNVEMMFPENMKKAVISTVQQCRGIAKQYKDICEASFYTCKCMYEADPKNFLFV